MSQSSLHLERLLSLYPQNGSHLRYRIFSLNHTFTDTQVSELMKLLLLMLFLVRSVVICLWITCGLFCLVLNMLFLISLIIRKLAKRTRVKCLLKLLLNVLLHHTAWFLYNLPKASIKFEDHDIALLLLLFIRNDGLLVTFFWSSCHV